MFIPVPVVFRDASSPKEEVTSSSWIYSFKHHVVYGIKSDYDLFCLSDEDSLIS